MYREDLTTIWSKIKLLQCSQTVEDTMSDWFIIRADAIIGLLWVKR